MAEHDEQAWNRVASQIRDYINPVSDGNGICEAPVWTSQGMCLNCGRPVRECNWKPTPVQPDPLGIDLQASMHEGTGDD